MITKIAAGIIKDKRLLVVAKEKYEDEFMLPGGKKESGETDVETLKREIKEELGVSINKYKYIDFYETKAMLSNEDIKISLYLVEIDGEPTPCSEIVKLKYINEKDFESLKLGTGITKFAYPRLKSAIERTI